MCLRLQYRMGGWAVEEREYQGKKVVFVWTLGGTASDPVVLSFSNGIDNGCHAYVVFNTRGRNIGSGKGVLVEQGYDDRPMRIYGWDRGTPEDHPEILSWEHIVGGDSDSVTIITPKWNRMQGSGISGPARYRSLYRLNVLHL